MAQKQRVTTLLSEEDLKRVDTMVERATHVRWQGMLWNRAKFMAACINGGLDRAEVKIAELEKLTPREEMGKLTI